MKRLAVLLLVAGPLFAQAVLEDWQCGTATPSPGPGHATTITCSGPHGFRNGQPVLITNATGRWAAINTQWEVLLKYTMSRASTKVYVNDTSQMDPTPGRVWTIYPETQYPQCITIPEPVTMQSIADSRSVIVRRSLTAAPHCNEDKMWGPLSSPVYWKATTNSQTPNRFTIPIDSSKFGEFHGQIRVVRAWPYPAEPAPYYYYDSADGSPIAMSPSPSGYQHFTIDGCPDKSEPIRCSFAFGDPVNQKGYFDFQAVKSVSVSKGVGTIHLAAPFTQNLTALTRTFKEGDLFWLWSMNEPDATFGTLNRPWIISRISDGNQTIVVNSMGISGVADGIHYPVAGTSKNFIFPIPADFYTGLGSPALVDLFGFPAGFEQITVKLGGTSFKGTMNRYRAWMAWGASMNSIPMEWGTYVYEQPSMSPNHGYHTINLDTAAGEWELEEFTTTPQHWVGSGPDVPQGTDPTYNGWQGYPAWTGEATHYLGGLGNSYMNLSSIYAWPGAQSGYIGPSYLDMAEAEPDEWISIRAMRYNPTNRVYHINLAAPPNPVAPLTAHFFYSTLADIKVLGISNTIPAGAATAAFEKNTGITQWNYDSPPMQRQAKIWFAIRPVMAVSGVSGKGHSPIFLTFDADPNMAEGDQVTVTGVGGNTAANCTNCKIGKVYKRKLWFRREPAPGGPTLRGTLNNIVAHNAVCTVNLTEAPGVVDGWRVAVTGVPAGGPGNETGSGGAGLSWFNVTAVAGNSFSFPCPGTAPGVYNTDADAAGGVYMGVLADPAVALSGTGNAPWNGHFTGSMISTENRKNFAEIAFDPPPAP